MPSTNPSKLDFKLVVLRYKQFDLSSSNKTTTEFVYFQDQSDYIAYRIKLFYVLFIFM